MPMSPLEAKRFLLTFTEELATTPRPFYGVNIVDVSAENLERFFAQFATFGDPSYPIGQCLRYEPYHMSMRDYGNGRLRILGIFLYQHPFDLEEYKKLTDDNPEYVEAFLGICNLMENYQWFTTCEMPELGVR